MAIERIFVPTDMSAHSERALEVGLEMARALGARLQVFHCYQEVAGAGAPVGSAGLDSKVRVEAEKQLKDLIGRLDSEGVEVELELFPGMFPENAVLEAARKTTADLIVLGTHGRTGLKHTLLGSVAEKVVREASCPVTVVKAPKVEAARSRTNSGAGAFTSFTCDGAPRWRRGRAPPREAPARWG